MISFKSAVVVFGTLLLSLQPCLSLPASAGVSPNNERALLARAEPRDFYLRIMPLGASITAGEEEPPDDKEKNGYRKFLRDKLRADGWKVNMVGNHNRGSMKDNDHEGVSGDTVKQVGVRAKQASYFWLPNVVLINAGTNDAEGDDISGVGTAMRETIDSIFSEVPTAVIILSTLLPSKEHQENIDSINKQYRDLANQYNQPKKDQQPGLKVILADMGDGFISLDDLHDGKHPTIEGNRKMAAVWLWAINQANDKNWFAEPSESGRFTDGDGSNCRKKFGSGDTDVRAGRQVLYASNSVITDDGGYVHSGVHRPDVGGQATGNPDTLKIFFADIVSPPGQDDPVKGQERDEFIWVTGNSDDREVKYWLNNGAGTFGDEEVIDVKDGCKTQGIHWGDVDGDALDDFICIAADGEMFVSRNTGGKPPAFESIGSYKTPEKGLGQANVRLGDIDGDGRLDYCVIENAGDIYCWRNDPQGWEDMGQGKPVFTAKGMGSIAGVEFVDLNGDGRYDWTWINNSGEVTTWTNQRGSDKSLIPRWVDAGVTHAAFDKEFANHGEGVVWGRLLNDEKTDYIHYSLGHCTGLNDPNCDTTWETYENQGHGGQYQKGDGIYWGDTTGSGVDDYIWISPEGEVNVFVNKNTKNDTDYYESAAWGDPYNLPTKLSRRALHIGDWDGDGKADVIGVTDKATGTIKVWYSRWDNSEFGWEEEEVTDSAKCDQGWGRRYYDSGAHFVDITGSGRVDYLCMAPDGTTTAWTRDDRGEWTNANQVKGTDNLDRADYHWADADGDGKADAIWTDKFSGDGWVYYNEDSGDSGNFTWGAGEKVFQGSSRGSNMYFPSLGGQGRGDMVGTDPTPGYGWIWFNTCPAGGDDTPSSGGGDNTTDGSGAGNNQDGGDQGAKDDGGVKDPGLPEYNPGPGNSTNPGDHWFCDEENASGWTPQLWNDHDIGRWLVQRSELYAGLDAQWPNDTAAGDFGVPRTIARFNGLTKDNAFDWPGTGCISAESTCDMDTGDLLNDNCPRAPERAFSLWAMRNLARLIQAWLRNLMDGVDTGSLYTAKIADTFILYTDDDPFPPGGAWATVVIGLMSTIGAFMTGPAMPAIFSVTGLLIVGSGASQFVTAPGATRDPRFDNFAEMQSGLGDMKNLARDAITAFFNQLFVEVPPKGNWDRATQLAGMLEDGTFASQDIGVGKDEVTSTQMTTLAQAAIISEAWNQGRMAIVKWSYDGDMAKNNWNPCGDNDWAIGSDRSYKNSDLYADHIIACVLDKNYIMLPMEVDDMDHTTRSKIINIPDVGQSEETLKDWGLTKEKIIRAAERTQRRTNKFMSRSFDDIPSMFDDVIKNPGPNKDVREDLIYSNIPVCDLDTIDVGVWENACNPSGTTDKPKPCLVQTVSQWCGQMTLGSGAEWPYTYHRP